MFELLSKFSSEEINKALMHYSLLFDTNAELEDREVLDRLYAALDKPDDPAVQRVGEDLEYLADVLWASDVERGLVVVADSMPVPRNKGIPQYASIWKDMDDVYVVKTFRRVWSNYYIAICVHGMFRGRPNLVNEPEQEPAPVGG